jgi:hypothetical protein
MSGNKGFCHSGEPRSRSGADAPIQYLQRLLNTLDFGFHQSDDFLWTIRIRKSKKGFPVDFLNIMIFSLCPLCPLW